GDERTTDQQDARLQPSDTYIIPSQPSRGGKAPEVSHRTNTHVLITFGLQLLLTALKRQKLVSTDEQHSKMLDPFVSILTDALNSKHVKITTIALRCLCWVVRFPLPSFKTHVIDIASRLFKLLKNHARTGGASGDNYEMVLSSFKTITVLIRDFTELKVTERQLRILLTFVEEDIHDYTRQSSAFPLLKAILSRKLQASEINDVMLKVAELSVTDQSSTVRLQCRQVLLQYLLDYPLGKKLKRYLQFFISQLEYEHSSGRESTLEMLVSIVNSFPEKVVYINSGLFFLPLCMRLVNDESVNCRKLTAAAIKALIEKLDVERRDNLFGIVMTWMNENKTSLQRLSCHVCGLFVEVESKSFDRRLTDVLPLLFDIIKPDNYNDKDEGRQKETISDHLLINALMTLTKILQECSVLEEKGKAKMTADAWDSILSHLTFPHTWVRFMASRLFGLLFSQHSPEDLIQLSKESSMEEYLVIDIGKKISLLCEAFLEQLKTQHLDPELGEQVVKNMFYLSKLVTLTEKEISDGFVVSPITEEASGHVTISLLLTKMCNIAKYESSQTPKLTQKRFSVFRWIAAVGSYLGSEGVRPYLIQMLKPVYRELDGGSTFVDEKLRELVQEVAELFKDLVGHEIFSQSYTAAKQSATEARAKRKMQNAFEMVANPEASVAKKMKRNVAKKESRKRKLDSKKPMRKSKKIKTYSL
ncbi:small subunit processome component 20 homolog, partial [Paramuricea clavata]